MFGFKRCRQKGMYSCAIAMHETPCDWIDYTGRPGVIDLERWTWRCLAKANGGFQLLQREQQVQLLDAEGQADYAYSRQWDETSGTFVSAAECMPPGGVPCLQIWCHLIRQTEDWAGLCSAILQERQQAGLSFYNDAWTYDGLTLLRGGCCWQVSVRGKGGVEQL